MDGKWVLKSLPWEEGSWKWSDWPTDHYPGLWWGCGPVPAHVLRVTEEGLLAGLSQLAVPLSDELGIPASAFQVIP